MKSENYGTTPEGLVPTSLLKWQGENLYLASSDKQVWVEPLLGRVLHTLKEHHDLWNIAQLRILPSPVSQKRAPIFGVPFDVALRRLSNGSPRKRIIKSMFKRLDGDQLASSGRGVVATMVAHLGTDLGKAGLEISLETWQVLDIDGETFYVHGIFIVARQNFVHFDGATMYHDAESKLHLFDRGRKAKGYGKTKHFRLDGDMSVDEVRRLASAFLPLEDLATEYLLTQQASRVQPGT